MSSLPAVIFQFALSPYKEWQQLAWTGALIITLAVLALSIAARALSARPAAIAINQGLAHETAKRNAQSPRGRRARCKDKVVVRGLNFYYGQSHALKEVTCPCSRAR